MHSIGRDERGAENCDGCVLLRRLPQRSKQAVKGGRRVGETRGPWRHDHDAPWDIAMHLSSVTRHSEPQRLSGSVPSNRLTRRLKRFKSPVVETARVSDPLSSQRFSAEARRLLGWGAPRARQGRRRHLPRQLQRQTHAKAGSAIGAATTSQKPGRIPRRDCNVEPRWRRRGRRSGAPCVTPPPTRNQIMRLRFATSSAGGGAS